MRVEGPFEVLGIDGRVVFHVSDQPAEAAARSQARVTISRGSAANYVLQFRGTPMASMCRVSGESAGRPWGCAFSRHSRCRPCAIGWGAAFLCSTLLGHHCGLVRTLGPSSGGVIELMNPSGAKMVEAGAYAYGVGRVVVGPMFKCAGNAGAMGLGIPDRIKGRLK